MKNLRTGVLLLSTIAVSGTLIGQAPPAPAQSAPAEQQLSPQQVEDLVAPVALYPDTLLSQILVACTYPLEVVEAQQWIQQNANSKDKKLMDEAQHQNWDPSIQAMVAFPGVLARLNQDIRWTTDLGNAFLSQQADVMSAVQRLRTRAQSNGKLQSTAQENVSTLSENGQTAIQIQPVNPETVYVPEYNPEWVWGAPEYGMYPPLFYPPFGVGFGFMPGVDLGLYFGGGWGIYGGFGWGWGPNWFGGNIFLNGNFFHRYGFRDFHPGLGGGNIWAHDPGHRLGVAYSSRALTNQYRGSAAARGGAAGGQQGRADTTRGNTRGTAQGSSRAAQGQRFGTPGFEQRNSGASRSAFSGAGNGGATRMQSDHGFSSMRGGGGFGASRGGGAGGSRGGGGRR